MNLQHILQKSAGYVEPQTSQESQPGAGVRDEDEDDATSSQSCNLPPSESLATSWKKELLGKVSIYVKNIFSYCDVFCIILIRKVCSLISNCLKLKLKTKPKIEQ